MHFHDPAVIQILHFPLATYALTSLQTTTHSTFIFPPETPTVGTFDSLNLKVSLIFQSQQIHLHSIHTRFFFSLQHFVLKKIFLMKLNILSSFSRKAENYKFHIEIQKKKIKKKNLKN